MKSPLLFSLLFLTSLTQAQPKSPEEYNQIGVDIWKTYVPKSGQAETVQGELLRAIEKLADEAQRNGNINFHKDCHGILIGYLRKYLSDSTVFSKDTIRQINQDLDTLKREDQPYTEDDLYDRLRQRVIDWYLQHQTPIAHPKNRKLYC